MEEMTLITEDLSAAFLPCGGRSGRWIMWT